MDTFPQLSSTLGKLASVNLLSCLPKELTIPYARIEQPTIFVHGLHTPNIANN